MNSTIAEAKKAVLGRFPPVSEMTSEQKVAVNAEFTVECDMLRDIGFISEAQHERSMKLPLVREDPISDDKVEYANGMKASKLARRNKKYKG